MKITTEKLNAIDKTYHEIREQRNATFDIIMDGSANVIIDGHEVGDITTIGELAKLLNDYIDAIEQETGIRL